MRNALTCFILASSFIAGIAAAQNAPERRSLELALSDETAQLRYIDPEEILGRDNSEIAYTIFLSEDRDVVGSAAAMMDTNLSVGAVNIRVGPQAYVGLLSEENNDVFALSFGVDARVNLARNRAIAIAGSAYWSPDVLTFGSADNLTDFMARAEAQLTDRLLGFAGYRWFELDLLNTQERKLQNEIFAGVRWQLR
jgi:hypothetical protein